MKKRKHSVIADLSFQAMLILMFVAVLFLAFDHINLAVNGVILCIVTLIFIITYFTNIKTAMIMDIIFVFLLVAYIVLQSVETGTKIDNSLYFWLVWPIAMIAAVSAYVRQHQLLDEENARLSYKLEKYVTIDDVTQMNNLLGFERDAAVYMNLSRRYQLELELVLWRLTYQEDLERLLGESDMNEAISAISDSIKKSLRKEDLIFVVDTKPYVWGTLLFSKPEAAHIVIEHVKEGVFKTELEHLTKQKDYSLDIIGAVIPYDGSMLAPLGFLDRAKKELWKLNGSEVRGFIPKKEESPKPEPIENTEVVEETIEAEKIESEAIDEDIREEIVEPEVLEQIEEPKILEQIEEPEIIEEFQFTEQPKQFKQLKHVENPKELKKDPADWIMDSQINFLEEWDFIEEMED